MMTQGMQKKLLPEAPGLPGITRRKSNAALLISKE